MNVYEPRAREERTHFVKCRERGHKRYRFIASLANGNAHLTTLRVHAARFTEDGAKKFVQDSTRMNPGWEFTTTAIGRR